MTREIHVQKFRDALSRLEERYQDYVQNKDWVPAFLVESLKESCIQRFAMCFDTAWKHMKKYLEEQLGNVDLPNSPNPIFKAAFASKVIDDAEMWIAYNDHRRATSHDYSGRKAEEALAVIGSFIITSIALYEKISGEPW